MSDLLARFFLEFSTPNLIIPILVIGLLFRNKKFFFHAACLIALDLVLNVALKGTFKIPLDPSIGKTGFAFPSGHMQLSIVFYGWLAFNVSSWMIVSLISLILTGIAWGLVHFHYHNFFDIAGGIFFGNVLVFFYYFLFVKREENFGALIILSTLIMIYNALIYHSIPKHAWIGYFVLFGLTLAGKIQQKTQLRDRYGIIKKSP